MQVSRPTAVKVEHGISDLLVAHRWMTIFFALAAAAGVFFLTPSTTHAQTTSAGSSPATSPVMTPKQRSGASTATATVGSREITASAAETNISSDGENARVQLDDHVITIEPERVLVDGGERAKLASSAKKITLSLSGRHLKVTADGEEVLSENISK